MREQEKQQRPAGMSGGNPAAMLQNISKAKDFKNTSKRLITHLKPHRNAVILVIIFAIASTVFAIISPKIMGGMTNQIVGDYINIRTYDQLISTLPNGYQIRVGTTGGDLLKNAPADVIAKIPADKIEQIKNLDLTHRPTINFEKLKETTILLIGLYILSSLFSFFQSWVMTNISQKVTYNFRKNISEKINRLPLKYFDSRSQGDIMSRVINDVDNISQTMNQSLAQIITSATTVIGILVIMFSINWMLTIVALLIVPASFLFMGTIIKKSQKHFKNQQESLGAINGHIEEMYSGHTVMRVFNGEERSLEKFRTINSEMYESSWKSQFYSGLMYPIMNFIGNLGFVGVSVLGGWLALKKTVSIGDIQAFIMYVRQFNQPIIQIANTASVMQSMAASAERVFEFMDEEEISEDKNEKIIENIEGYVEFKNVVFGYDSEKTIIKNLSAKIKPGQRIAIVGPTGAGKTTIVNLLMRFYDINSGSILLDDVDIYSIKRSELRKKFGMVLQDTWLFNGTIGENISYSRPTANKEEIIEAAKSAHADRFIRTLPHGYDMILNEEVDNISQGEKQLITIARAMLANPPILILDEATSSVDTRTEILIQEAMDRLMKGRTSFIIAHRLSTIKNADLILVMNDGELIEQGKHEELLSKKGFYASIYNSQFAAPIA